VDNNDVLIQAFSEAVAVTLREMAGLETVVRDSRSKVVVHPEGISALLRLTPAANSAVTPLAGESSASEGDFAIDFPAQVAMELTRRVFAGSGAEINEAMVPDCVGEVANVVAGQAKTLLVGTAQHFVFSTPALLPVTLPHPAVERMVIRFMCEIGEFLLYLRLPS
jgi:CheY-specific phosphatase CheX